MLSTKILYEMNFKEPRSNIIILHHETHTDTFGDLTVCP